MGKLHTWHVVDTFLFPLSCFENQPRSIMNIPPCQTFLRSPLWLGVGRWGAWAHTLGITAVDFCKCNHGIPLRLWIIWRSSLAGRPWLRQYPRLVVPTRPHAGPSVPLGGVMGAHHSGVGGSLCTAFRAREHPEIGAEPAESLFLARTWH